MKTRLIQISVVVAVLLLAVWGFSLWIEGHDKHVFDDAQQQYELNSLRKEVADLKTEQSKIQEETKQAVAAEDTARQQATTPEKQIEYVAVRVPGVSLKHDTTDPHAPTVTFPESQLPNMADYVNKSEDAKKSLAGCRAEVSNLEQQNAALEKQTKLPTAKKVGLLRRVANFTMDGALSGAGGLAGALIAGPQGAAVGAGGGFVLAKLIHR